MNKKKLVQLFYYFSLVSINVQFFLILHTFIQTNLDISDHNNKNMIGAEDLEDIYPS